MEFYNQGNEAWGGVGFEGYLQGDFKTADGHFTMRVSHMADDAELKVGGFTFKGVYLAAALPLLGSLSGGIYYGYDVVNRFWGVEESVKRGSRRNLPHPSVRANHR